MDRAESVVVRTRFLSEWKNMGTSKRHVHRGGGVHLKGRNDEAGAVKNRGA